MTDRELLQQALASLEWAERRYSYANLDLFNKPIEAIRTRLAQPEPEPVAYWRHSSSVKEGWNEFSEARAFDDDTPLYAAPPKKEWVNLTNEEIWHLSQYNCGTRGEFAKAIEAKLKEKNAT
jgi:hypothetical protein